MFIWHMARTDMKAQHYDTAMGVVWLVLDPLLMAGTFYLIRLVFGATGPPSQRAHVIANLIMGVIFFYFVRDIVQGGARSIVGNKVMVLNTAAPRACYPTVEVVRAACTLVPGLLVYFLFHQITGQPWGMSLLFLPVVMVLLVIFGFGLRSASRAAGRVLPRRRHPAALRHPHLDVRHAGDVHDRRSSPRACGPSS